jgi:hypothetical protein
MTGLQATANTLKRYVTIGTLQKKIKNLTVTVTFCFIDEIHSTLKKTQ